MTANEFNSKIHMPSVITAYGLNDFKCVKLSTYGWFAYNRELSHICNIFELFPLADRIREVYKKFTLQTPEFQESKIFYSEVSENKLRSNMTWLHQWGCFVKGCVQEAEYGVLRMNGLSVRTRVFLEELGYPKFTENGIGIVTRKLLDDKAFGPLKLPSNLVGKIIIPSYATPKHLASIEYADISDLKKRYTLDVNGEKGYYGKPGNMLLSEVSEFGMHVGHIWNKAVDPWNRGVVTLSPNLKEEHCIKLWAEAKNTVFNQNPLDLILANKRESYIHNFITDLNLTQIKELEEKTGAILVPTWKKQQEDEIKIGNFKFIRRDSRYYLERFRISEEFTNFAIKLIRIVKQDDGYITEGLIYYNNEEIVFHLPEKVFRSPVALMNALRALFLETGIGVPVVSPNFKSYLPTVIFRFNPNVKIDNSLSDKEKGGDTKTTTAPGTPIEAKPGELSQ